MAKGTFDKIDLTQKDTPNNLSYEGLNTSVDYQRPKAGLLKKILEQSPESAAFSPYKKQEKPTKVKSEQKTATPAPMPVQAKPIISQDVLEPIINQNVEANKELKTAIENTVAKKFRTGVMPEDVYRTNLAKGVQTGDFKITEDEQGNKEIIRSAPSVLGAIADGWNGYFNGIEESVKYYNPFVSEEDKIREREAKRRYNQMVIDEEASKAREYGGMAGQTAAQLATTFAPIGAAGVGAKLAKVGLDAIKISAANSGLQAAINALSQGNQSEEEAYNIARDQGLSEQDAYDVSKANRFTYLSSGALEGVISTLADAQIGKAFSAASKKAGEGFVNATKAYLQKAKEPAVSLALDASVAGLASSIRDLATETTTGQDLNVLDRALDNAKGELIAGGAIATIASAGGAASRKIDKWYKSQATNYLSTLDRNFVESELKNKQAEGIMTEQQVKDEMKKIDEWNKIRQDNPNVPEEKQPTIYGLIMQKRQLSDALKKADESNQAEIAQQISNLDKRINEANTNPEPLAGEIDEEGVTIPLTPFGFPEGSQETTTTLQIKPEENATTISEGQKQEGPTTSNISQYQGTEGEQKQATNEADNRNRPVSSETQQEVIPESFNTEDGKTAWNTARKVQEESIKRGRKQDAVRDNVIQNFKKSKAFELANDVTREQMLRDLDTELFGTKQKSAPSVDRILGNVKKTITVDESTALKRLLKRQEQASRETATWIKDTRQTISKGLSELARRGTIKTAQLQSILKKYDAVNLSNNESVDKFVEYVSNVINDANYDKQLSDANRFKGLIKKYAKSKVGQQNLSAAAKAFLSIDPSKVKDLPRYAKVANTIINGIKPSRRVGTEVSFNQPFNTETVGKYIREEIADQETAAKNAKMAEYQDLVDSGVITPDMSFDQMEEMIAAIESGAETQDIKDKSRYIKAYIDKRFGSLSAIAKSILTNGTDGFSSVTFDVSPKDKARIEELLKIDITSMKLDDAYRAIEALSNFTTNGQTSGLDAVLAGHEGDVNSEAFAKKYPKAPSDAVANSKAIKKKGFTKFAKELGTKGINAFLENFSSIPVYFNTIFGDTKSTEFLEKSGFKGVENGRAKAVTAINTMIDNFVKTFEKKKPNGEDFSSQNNVFERGIYAYVRRNLGLDEKQNQAEFLKKKELAQSSINAMRESGGDDAAVAEVYQEIYDKILADANTIQDVEAKMDKANIEAVDWWTNKWAEYYPELKDVSLNIYNQDLGNDNRYNPVIFRTLKREANAEQDPLETGAFASYADNIPSKKSGVLMKTTPLSDVPAGRYIDFNFDYNTSKAMDRALTDIYTARDIKKLRSFVKSKNYNKIFNSQDQANLALDKMKNYIVRARGFDAVDPSSYTELRKTFNGLNTLVASRSLASLWAPIKQTIPTLTNTLVNAGASNVNIGDFRDPDVINFIKNSGRAIANRGVEAEGFIESTNKILDKTASGPLSKLGGKIVDINKWWLQKMLGNFDKNAAIISFMAYYRQSLKEQGIDPNGIDWKNHKINDFAADYAQNMVDVQQNVTDRALAGEFMASRDNTKTFIRNTLMPFGSFNINQKARMLSDIKNAGSKTNTLQDRQKARRSLYALAAEMAVFSAVKSAQMIAYTTAANALAGVVLGEKEKEDLYNRAIKSMTTNMFNDILSPLPFTDKIVDRGINAVLNNTVYKGTPSDLRFNLYQGDNKDEFDNLGFAGIAMKKASQAGTMINEGISGDVVKSYFGKDYVQKIADEDRGLAAAMAAINVASQLGILPADNLPNATMKVIEGKAMNKQQKEAYDAIKALPTSEAPVDVKIGIAKAAGYKDPESRAKYLISLYKKGGEAFMKAMAAADEAETESGKNPLAKILDDATAANVTAITSGDEDKMKFGRIFSLKSQESRVFKMMEMKKAMGEEKFYNTLKWGMEYGLLNDSGLSLFGKKLRETVKENSPEYEMAIRAIEEE